jgi:hypothetical protein
MASEAVLGYGPNSEAGDQCRRIESRLALQEGQFISMADIRELLWARGLSDLALVGIGTDHRLARPRTAPGHAGGVSADEAMSPLSSSPCKTNQGLSMMPRSRRRLDIFLALSMFGPFLWPTARAGEQERAAAETTASWVKSPSNPVLGGDLGTCFDVSVLKEGDAFRMWFSWRPKKSIAQVESRDGIRWSSPVIVLGPNDRTDWEADINRPVVLRDGDIYRMWYTGQARGRSWIGYATSRDGKTWRRESDRPVLSAETPWEKVAVMCPHVIHEADLYRMWYSGGEQYEPGRAAGRRLLHVLHRLPGPGPGTERPGPLEGRQHRLGAPLGQPDHPPRSREVGPRCGLQALCDLR